MDKSIIFSLLFIVFTGAAYYFWQEHEANLVLAGQKTVIPAETQETLSETVKEKEIQYPVPEQPVPAIKNNEIESSTQPVAVPFILPLLNESDDVMQGVLARIYEPARLVQIFIFTEFVRHVVVIVDNLTAKKLPRRFVFTHRPDTSFIVSKSTIEDEYFLDRKNFERYRRFLHFSNAVSNQQLASIYVRYYPLFQEAYEELGYPGRYFNDRVIEIIDHLMQTPDIIEPIRLIQPKVYYLFADPDIEKLSVGQKILIRIGSENAEQLKIRLKDLRSILTTLDP